MNRIVNAYLIKRIEKLEEENKNFKYWLEQDKNCQIWDKSHAFDIIKDKLVEKMFFVEYGIKNFYIFIKFKNGKCIKLFPDEFDVYVFKQILPVGIDVSEEE